MKKPFYQKAIEYGIPFIGGLLAFGGIIDSIASAHQIISLQTAIIITSIFILLVGLYVYKIKNNSVRWQAADGSEFPVKKINKKIFISIAGGIFLTWLPIVINLLNSESKLEKGKYAGTKDTSKIYFASNLSYSPDVKTTDSLAQLARQFVKVGKLKEADSAYTRIFEINNEENNYLIEAADFFTFRGDYFKASALIKRLLNLTTESKRKAFIFFVLGQNFLSEYEVDSAVSYFQKSAEEYYDLQIISKSYLPNYIYAKAEEIRIKNKIKKAKSQDLALDPIASLARECDDEICKYILFTILMDKVNSKNSADDVNHTKMKVLAETNRELDSALVIANKLVKKEKSYELAIQLIRLTKSWNNFPIDGSMDKKALASVNSELDSSISLCGKYSNKEILAPEILYLRDFPHIFRNTKLQRDNIVDFTLLSLNNCTRLTVILGHYFGDTSLFYNRKNEIIKCIQSVSAACYKSFLRYPLLNGSSALNNMIDLTSIAFVFTEYEIAESISSDIIKLLKQARDLDFLNKEILYQAKHFWVLAKFRKLEENSSRDTAGIDELLQTTKDIKSFYVTWLKSNSGSKNIKGAKETIERTLGLIKELQTEIKNYKSKVK